MNLTEANIIYILLLFDNNNKKSAHKLHINVYVNYNIV